MARVEARQHSSSLIPPGGLLQAVVDEQNNIVGYTPITLEGRHYVLMPDRRRVQPEPTAAIKYTDRANRAVPAPVAKHSESARKEAQARILATPTVPPSGRATVTPTVPRPGSYVYSVRDRRVKPEGLTKARQDAYTALLRAKAPMTVREVALAAKHPVETTQQLVVALVKAKLAKREQRG